VNISLTERRQIENEMIFRRANEKVGTDLDTLDAMHMDDGNPELVSDDTLVLHFKCECSDENCDTRIPMKLHEYQKIHKNRDSFIIKLKHQVESIEKVILTKSNYNVVEKNNSTPEPSATLNETSVDNS